MNPRLTIIDLAKQVGASPSKLRAVINTTLGHKNFSAYLNRYRIEAVKTALDDPESVDTSILQIALDNGFNSLSPFNRAFLNYEGMTPSEYKKQCKETLGKGA